MLQIVMAEAQRARGRQRKRSTRDEGAAPEPAPAEVHPSIALLRGRHRAAHPDTVSILDSASHLLMLREWPITCPRFLAAIQQTGLHCVSYLRYIRLDHHLITALVERWSPDTNTFHLPVGEMTVTLQDVAMILGVRIDGPALIGRIVVGHGRRWASWPECSDELLGSHPLVDEVYTDPQHPHISSTFRMGQARAQTCLPLRWLRWTFFRDSYADLAEEIFTRHVRAYVMFLIGTFLLPDTSGCEVHLQYLPLLEDLQVFSTFSIGAAVLAHLYRELHEATKPRRTNMAGCLQLLQVWSWEHLHVGRPTLTVPVPADFHDRSLGFRWNERYVRDVPVGNVKMYRNELDGLLQSQVIWEPYTADIRARLSDLCSSGQQIWLARVPLISWKRVEWYLPDRVLLQFGHHPRTDVQPIDQRFERVDGRGKADTDWVEYHLQYIGLWDRRADQIVRVDDDEGDRTTAMQMYLSWFRSWASLYLLQAPTEPPTTYYDRAPVVRILTEHTRATYRLLAPFFRAPRVTPLHHALSTYETFCMDVQRQMHGFFADDEIPSPGPAFEMSDFDFVPATAADVDASTSHGYTPATVAGPSEVAAEEPQDIPTQASDVAGPSEVAAEEPHQLRRRPRHPAEHYTPGTDALPQRYTRRRRD